MKSLRSTFVAAAAALTLSLMVLGAPAVAFAQHGEHEGEHAAGGEHGGGHGEVHLEDVFKSTEFWGSVVNFGLLLVVLVGLGRKPMNEFLSTRKRQVEEGLAEAARLKAQAEAKYDEYTKRLQALDKELEKIRTEMVKAGEAERDRLVAEAEDKAARMRRDTEFLIEQRMKALRDDLTEEAVSSAVAAARQALEEKTNASDQQKLATEYLERLKKRMSDPPDLQGRN